MSGPRQHTVSLGRRSALRALALFAAGAAAPPGLRSLVTENEAHEATAETAADCARGSRGFAVRRLRGNPILRPHMDSRMGGNVQGPSLVRVPDWVESPLGRYYLYFADHKGAYIRLAYADRLAGPWRVHAPGTLQLGESLFRTTPPAVPPDADTPATAASPSLAGFAREGTEGVPSRLEDATVPHIASPDAHVREDRREIVLYYHGLEGYASQVTRVATSTDGLSFAARAQILGNPYFRAFRYADSWYALAMPGVLYRSRDGLADFERGPTIFGPDMRHSAVLVRGDRLHVFWTRVGDAPERILLSVVDLAGDFTTWHAGDPMEVLRPERPWEGAELPVRRSVRSAIAVPANQLRDPAVFEEGGRTYLLYAVAGESGIAIAELRLRC